MTIATQDKLQYNWKHVISLAGLHIGALFALLPSNFNWTAVGLTVFMHWITGGLGITLGWHRMLTHRSFQTPKFVEYFLAFCGALACQGGIIDWVGLHRLHHTHSDQNAIDPHNAQNGFWWSHIGWMLYKGPAHAEIARCTKDISSDPFYQFLQKYFLPMQIVFGVLLYLAAGWSFVVWVIFARLILVYHCTWFVNSATHKFGYRTYETKDSSTNCWWVAVLTYGEGWHNNHHAYQYSARHGMKWWEFDFTWVTIQVMEALGLASKVKLPAAK